MIRSFFLFIYKKLFKGQGGAMETPHHATSHHGNASKNRLIKHCTPVKGGGPKSLKAYRRLPFHFHGTKCI